MFPVLFGLISAMVFGLTAFHVYGLEGLMKYAWIDYVFWSLILTGGIVSLLDETHRCLACRVSDKFHFIRWLDAFCDRTFCPE